MKADRYTKVVLTIIALCLIWIVAHGIPSASVQAQGGRFSLATAVTDASSVFRLNNDTGDITIFVRSGMDALRDRWDSRVITSR